MLKILPKKNAVLKEIDPNMSNNFSPKNETLNAILNYSKSLQVTKIENQSVLIHLN